jgi:putative ABC transport system permease protein
MWRFALQNLVTRPVRSGLAIVGLTIPIVAILGLFSLTHGIRSLMGNTLARMKGLIVMHSGTPAPVFSELPSDLAEKIRRVPGTGVVAPEVWRIAPPLEGRNQFAGAVAKALTSEGKEGSPLQGFAETIMIEGEQLPEHLKIRSGAYKNGMRPASEGGGRYLDESDVGQPHVVISTKIARDYPNADGSPKEVGDSLRIDGRPFQIVGLYETGSLLIDETIVMEIQAARELLHFDHDKVSAFYVEPAPGSDMDQLQARIAGAVPDVEVRSMAQFNLQVGNIMGQLDLFLMLTIGLALLVGGVGIANTMLTSATERFVEFGVMRANGWTRRNVLGLVTAESAWLGLFSGLAASLLAIGGILVVNRFLARYELELQLTAPLVIGSNLVAVGVAIAAGLYPAWHASRMTPMAAIRNEAS